MLEEVDEEDDECSKKWGTHSNNTFAKSVLNHHTPLTNAKNEDSDDEHEDNYTAPTFIRKGNTPLSKKYNNKK